MSINTAPSIVTVETYQDLFDQERVHEYPMVDAFEQRLGYALPRWMLERAARVLSCPYKAAAPNWQHGRVIYAVTRSALQGRTDPVRILDIGTAKGFSALCLQWALSDSGCVGTVTSVDVMCPQQRCRRNTIAEVYELKTLHEILEPYAAAKAIDFVCRPHGSRDWLKEHPERVDVAYVDGKHTYDAVSFEAGVLSAAQQSGDVIVFDDVQIPGIAKAVIELRGYDVEYLHVLSTRGYAIARKR